MALTNKLKLPLNVRKREASPKTFKEDKDINDHDDGWRRETDWWTNKSLSEVDDDGVHGGGWGKNESETKDVTWLNYQGKHSTRAITTVFVVPRSSVRDLKRNGISSRNKRMTQQIMTRRVINCHSREKRRLTLNLWMNPYRLRRSYPRYLSTCPFEATPKPKTSKDQLSMPWRIQENRCDEK